MNEIIKKIEDAQLKESITDFRVGDTIRVHGKIKEGNRERIQIFEAAQERPLRSVRHPTVSALRRPGRFILRTLRRSKWYVTVKSDVQS